MEFLEHYCEQVFNWIGRPLSSFMPTKIKSTLCFASGALCHQSSILNKLCVYFLILQEHDYFYVTCNRPFIEFSFFLSYEWERGRNNPQYKKDVYLDKPYASHKLIDVFVSAILGFMGHQLKVYFIVFNYCGCINGAPEQCLYK